MSDRKTTLAEEGWRYRVVCAPRPGEFRLRVLDGYNTRDREQAEKMLARSLAQYRAQGEEVEGYIEWRPAGRNRFVPVEA